MSSLAFGALTRKRYQAGSRKSFAEEPPGIGKYIDVLAALIPGEVLALHAAILQFTMEEKIVDGQSTMVISELPTLKWSFFGLIVVSIILYLVARKPKEPGTHKLEWSDILRAAIPPLAFVAWTMLQNNTAFDAVWPDLPFAPRAVIALFMAVLLSVAASVLAKKADRSG